MLVKQVVVFAASILALALAGWVGYAKAKVDQSVQANQAVGAKVRESAKTDDKKVKIYATASRDKLLANVLPTKKLIPIFKQDDWLKVGIAETGVVGWINLEQWHQARANYLKPDIQTFYLYKTENKKEKPTINVIAYKNGEKLSDAEAKKLYKSMKERQLAQQYEMTRLHNDFQRFFRNFTFMDINPWFAELGYFPY